MVSSRAQRAGLKELEIFDYFQIDSNLPKYKKKEEKKSNDLIGFDNTPIPAFGTVSNNSIAVDGRGQILQSEGDLNEQSILLKTFKYLLKKLFKKPVKKFTILQFFVGLSKSISDLKTTKEIANYYEQAIIKAKENGQTALMEKLNDLLFVCKNEANLVDLKYTKYVTEHQVVDFYNKITEDKRIHLKLSWIKNFVRIIPSNVLEIKKQLDENEIFDNYVILHYDTELNSEALTEREKEYKKDPILFGVIHKSRKLYYIADWKDEVCDLTLDEMFSTLKEKVFEINNDSVKSFINNGGIDINKNKENKTSKSKKK